MKGIVNMTAASTAASSLPPVRTSCHVPLSLMTSISEETIALWLKLGALEKLEQAVLDGYGDQLCGKTSRIPQVNKFLKQVPLFQSKIREIHLAVSQGRLRDVQHLIDRKKLAFCRDHNGASPLHKAVIFGHQDVIEYLVRRYGGVIHIRDHQGRTALHYAAFLPDGGELYQYLLALGADERAMDVYGRQPSYYLDGQNESTLQQLRNGTSLNGIRKIKPRYYGQASSGQSFANLNKSTVSKSQVRELISEGNLTALEELVLQGQGDRLLGETSTIPKIQSFLNIVPMYMERIYDVHRAVMRDQLEHIVILLENRKLALARDQLGATPLHKSVWFGHYKIAHYISNQFPETLNALDMEGRTALHYAAALKDNKNMYGVLIEAGANKGVYDNKGKMPDYYSQYPEHLNLEDVIKRCHKVNANYLANTASRIKGKSPIRQTPPPSNEDPNSPHSEENNGSSKENSQSNDSGNENELISLLQKEKLSKRIDINSANIRKWVSSKDMDKIAKAVMEGYGEKVVKVHTSNDSEDKGEIGPKINEMVDKVNAIHTAVSNDDLTELKNQLDTKDYALAKDHMGMTPLHKAVLLRKHKIVGYLIEKFPETIKAKNKNGLTALHYASAMSRKDGQQLYKMLLQAGADPKARDNHGRTPDYYKTHLITMPNKGTMKSRPGGSRGGESLNRFSRHGVLERMTTALQRGDVELIQDLVLEGHGKHLLGKTSWHEEVKNFLKELPTYLNNMQSFREAIKTDDIEQVKEHLSKNEKFLRAKDETGAFPLHLAANHGASSVLEHFAKTYPTFLNSKDSNGKTALHIVSQKGNHTLHKLLKQAGADSKILDQKGRTADFYHQSSKSEHKSNGDEHKASPNTSSDSIYSNSSSEGKSKPPSRFMKRKSSIALGSAMMGTPKTETVSEISEDSDIKTCHETSENETESKDTEESKESSNEATMDSVKENDDENDSRTGTRESEDANDNETNDTDESNLETPNHTDTQEAIVEDVEKENDDHVDPGETEAHTQEEDTTDESPEKESTEELNESEDKEKEDHDVENEDTPDSEAVKEQKKEDQRAADAEDIKNDDNHDEQGNYEVENATGKSDENEIHEESTENDLDKPDEDKEDENNHSENVLKEPKEETEDNAEIQNTNEDDKKGDEDGELNDKATEQTESNEPETEDSTKEHETDDVDQKTNEDPTDTLKDTGDDKNYENEQPETITEIGVKSFEGITVAEVGSGNPDNSENNNETKLEEIDKVEDAAIANETEIEKAIEEDMDATEVPKSATSEEKPESPNTTKEESQEEPNSESKDTPDENASEEKSEENTENADGEDKDPKEENAEKSEPNEDQVENNETETKIEGNKDTEIKEEGENVDASTTLENKENTDEQSENPPNVLENQDENNPEKTAGEASHQTKDHLDELIEHWIKEGDLLRLEHVVLAGQGDRLIERTSDDKQVQDFLDLVPIYMAKIRAVHEAVAKGQLREVRSVLTRKRFALSRDHVGASPLHLAVLHGHTDVSTYIISHFPETMDGPDNEGRTPLHYATALPDKGTLYRLLKSAGADENIEDKAGQSPKFYMSHPNTLTLDQLFEPYSRHE